MDITRNVAVRKRTVVDEADSEVKSNQITRSDINTNSVKLLHRRYSHPDLTGLLSVLRDSESSQKPNEVHGVLDASQPNVLCHQNQQQQQQQQGNQNVIVQNINTNHSNFEIKSEKGAEKDMDEGCAISGRLEIRVLQKNPQTSDNKEKYAFYDTDKINVNNASKPLAGDIGKLKGEKIMCQATIPDIDSVKKVISHSLLETVPWKKATDEKKPDEGDDLCNANCIKIDLNKIETSLDQINLNSSQNSKEFDNAIDDAKNSNTTSDKIKLKYFDKKEANLGSKIPIYNANMRTKCESWSESDFARADDLTPGKFTYCFKLHAFQFFIFNQFFCLI